MVRGPSILGDIQMNKQVLQDFLSLFSSESTKNVYKWAMKKFLRFVADKHGIDSLDEYLTLSLPIKECQGDVRRFFASIAEMPPKSQETIEGSLRSFFNEYNINISNDWWKRERRRSKRKRARPLTQDRIPNTEELRRILSHMPIQGKALYLVLSSGGMRIGDAVSIDLEDLNLNQNLSDGTPYHEVLIFDQKTGNRHRFDSTTKAEARRSHPFHFGSRYCCRCYRSGFQRGASCCLYRFFGHRVNLWRLCNSCLAFRYSSNRDRSDCIDLARGLLKRCCLGNENRAL